LNQLRREGDEQAGEKAVTFDAQSGTLRTTLCFEVPEANIQSIKVDLAATLTSSDLLFEPPLLDFGRIPISQTGLVHFRLINSGLIPLKFGFMDVPQVFSVQPNDGFGTLLPQETYEMRAYFSPTEVADCSCNLITDDEQVSEKANDSARSPVEDSRCSSNSGIGSGSGVAYDQQRFHVVCNIGRLVNTSPYGEAHFCKAITLVLECICIRVKPFLEIVDNEPVSILDFGTLCSGSTSVRSLQLHNSSDFCVKVS
uniref:ASH domain-containing protein n=1 Tax=Schistocephalus solidus TaxID=70667 RepID=A0A183TSY6_SCHSO